MAGLAGETGKEMVVAPVVQAWSQIMAFLDTAVSYSLANAGAAGELQEGVAPLGSRTTCRWIGGGPTRGAKGIAKGTSRRTARDYPWSMRPSAARGSYCVLRQPIGPSCCGAGF